jgi:hypothetical protein
MAQELLETALRVLDCYTRTIPRKPILEDVTELRAAFEAGTRIMPPDVLAVEVIQREVKRMRTGRAAK